MAKRRRTEPRKIPTQARARETVRALVEATARILVASGPDALTTNHVAEVAGVGIGSLYQYFPSKSALVAAVIDHRLAEDAEAMRAVLDGPDAWPDRARALVRWAVRRQRDGAPLMAALLPLLSDLDREHVARAAIAGLVDDLRERLLAEPDAVRPDLRTPEALDAALFVVSRALRWATNEALVERPALLDDPVFTGELERIVAGLFAEPRLREP